MANRSVGGVSTSSGDRRRCPLAPTISNINPFLEHFLKGSSNRETLLEDLQKFDGYMRHNYSTLHEENQKKIEANFFIT